MRTADTIEAKSAAPENTRTTTLEVSPAERIRKWQWKPGQSGNPGGRPKNDVAKAICQAAFENNAEAIYKGIADKLMKGNGFLLQVASDRAYGKLKESLDIGVTDGLAELLTAARKRSSNGNGNGNH